MSSGRMSAGSVLCSDGSCRAAGCGAGMWVDVFSRGLRWHIVNTKCEPVPKANTLDAGIRGCEMLTECMGKWVERWPRMKGL